jgi:asparagine synthetase B (glutamine-hydrolysing)
VARATALASAAAWVPLEVKRGILREGVWERAGCDEALVRAYADEWSRWCEPFARADAAEGPLRAHLRFLQRVNLHGLLVRLDQSTMRASVEGRTPFADVAVARWASMLPSSMTLSGVGEREGDGADAMPVESTKRVLREALWPILRRAVKPGHGDGEELTRGVGRRAKASFPLPFQEWVRDQHEVLLRSPLAGEFFSPAAIGVVAADPAKAWNIAWPMMNITMWAQRWWGADSMASAAARGGGLGLGLGLGLGGGALRG